MSVRQNIQYNLAFFLFIAILVGFSSFFTYQVEAFRARTSKARLDHAIASGTMVSVADIIDGDELLVQLVATEQRFVVRFLGLKSFDAVANDNDLGVFGRAAVDHLEDRLIGERVTLEFDTFQTDSKGRVLAFVRLQGDDVGQALIAEGLSLVYRAYPFSRETAYARAMERARNDRRGLWGVDRSAQRARALLSSWQAAERKP